MSVILCTAGYDHTIRFWEALSGICSRIIQHPDSQVNRLCISPDKRWLAAAGNQNVKLYDIRGSNPNPLVTFEGHTSNVTGVAFHCEGRWMVTSSEDGTVKIWDTRSGTIQRNYIHGVPVNDVVIHPNQGEIISADRGGSVRIWDLGENKCTHELVPEPGCSVSSISIAGDGTIIAAGNNNGNVYLWHLAPSTSSPSSYLNGTSSSSSSSSSSSNQYTTITPLTSFQAHNAYITRVLLSPDTHHLATCSADHNARIWTVDLHVKERIRNPLNPALPALPHNPNLPLSTITNKTVTVEEMARQQRTQPYLHHSPNNPSINTQSSSPSSSSVLTAAATTPQTPPPFTTAAATAATNPANKALDAPFFLEATLDAHQRWVWDCAFSADSAYLVTSCSDHYARLWELGTRLVIRQYNGHHRGTVCVALNDFQEVRG